jgi:hypothetical protein
MLDLGIVVPGTTLNIPFNTYSSDDPAASMTITTLAVTDIQIYKDGSLTQRASDSGFAVDTDLDAIVGVHAAIARFTIGYPAEMINTSIATLSTQTSFTLTNGPAEADALNGMWCIIHDVASRVQLGYAVITDYAVTTKTVTLAAGVPFTAAAGDNISIMGPAPLQAVAPANALDVTATGGAGIDWANVENPTTAVDLSATDIQLADTVTTLTGHTAQTGDSFARIGATGSGLTTLATAAALTTHDGKLDTVDTNIDTLLTRITATLFSGITSLAEWLGLIAGKQAADATALTEIKATGAGSGTYDETTDSNEALRDTAPMGSAMVGTDSAALASVCTEARLSELDAATGGKMANQVDIIQTDTTTDIPATITTAQNDLDLLTGADGATLASVQGNYAPAIPSEVLTQVNAALDTAISELGVAAPTATPTLRTGLMLLYMALRNRLDVQTSGTDSIDLYNNAGTKIAGKLITDDGSDYSEAEMA